MAKIGGQFSEIMDDIIRLRVANKRINELMDRINERCRNEYSGGRCRRRGERRRLGA